MRIHIRIKISHLRELLIIAAPHPVNDRLLAMHILIMAQRHQKLLAVEIGH